MTEAPADAPIDPARAARRALRQRLLAEREAFVASPLLPAATAALGRALCDTLAQLEPDCLGLYCAFPSEFNAALALAADARFADMSLALPFARKAGRTMEFRRWDGAATTLVDECGIGTAAGKPVVPDVLVVPCVGFTDAGHRLGYGGGYYDRWLADHPEATAIGVVWSWSRVPLEVFEARAHDIPLAAIVTESGAV